MPTATNELPKLEVWSCVRCKRLWIKSTWANGGVSWGPGDPANYIRGKAGSHFAHRSHSWDLCQGGVCKIRRPAVIAAYMLGGEPAVTELCPPIPADKATTGKLLGVFGLKDGHE